MKILLVDDHALFREGMHYVLRKLDDEAEILDAGNLQDAMAIAARNKDLDLALLDLNMPGSEGAASIKLFHMRHPAIPIVVVSGTEQRDDIERSMKNGAMGFICKLSTGEAMVHALQVVLDGGIYSPPQLLDHSLRLGEGKRSWRSNEFGLTARQMEVLQLLARGMSNKDIAQNINLAEGTVKIHVAAIFSCLNVSRRVDAVNAGLRLGLIAESSIDS
jgi:DNA-binding NarL/FixJ family response regulator